MEQIALDVAQQPKNDAAAPQCPHDNICSSTPLVGAARGDQGDGSSSWECSERALCESAVDGSEILDDSAPAVLVGENKLKHGPFFLYSCCLRPLPPSL